MVTRIPICIAVFIILIIHSIVVVSATGTDDDFPLFTRTGEPVDRSSYRTTFPEEDNETSDNHEDASPYPLIAAGIIILLLVGVVTYITHQEEQRQKKERKEMKRRERRKEREAAEKEDKTGEVGGNEEKVTKGEEKEKKNGEKEEESEEKDVNGIRPLSRFEVNSWIMFKD